MERNVIEASEGMILTDGRIYGSKIYLAEGVSPENFKEITKEEYNLILKEEEDVG